MPYSSFGMPRLANCIDREMSSSTETLVFVSASYCLT